MCIRDSCSGSLTGIILSGNNGRNNNNVFIPAAFALSKLEILSNELGQKSWFSRIDMESVADTDTPKYKPFPFIRIC